MSAPREPIIRFDHASFGFPGLIALQDISLSIYEGEFVGVIGPNGSGKTTLCRAVLGLLAPSRVTSISSIVPATNSAATIAPR